MSSMQNRRDFLKSGAWIGTAATTSYAGIVGANERLNVGCIGTGGRCRALMKPLARVPDVRIGAICDIWDPALDQARPLADPQAFVTKKFPEILARKDIDAVVIGSPDHWHVPLTVAACSAGKDVYVEKPLTHEPGEGQAVIDAQDKQRRIVQVGMQQRSMTHLIQARERIAAGKLGQVLKVHMTWNRNTDRVRRRDLKIDPRQVDWDMFLGTARRQPFDEYRFRNWRWFWDFGGGLFTDLMVHWVDVAHWFLDLPAPTRAVSVGSHITAQGVWETPDTVQTVLVYPNQVQVYFEGTFGNARNGAMIEVMGSDATLYADRGRFEIIPERTQKTAAEEVILGSGRRGQDYYDKPDGEYLHLANWVDCVRSRKKPNAPAEAGVQAAAAAHLANRALRGGGTATA